MIDILTVYGQYNPFRDLQIKNINRYSSLPFTHYTVQGGSNGSYSHGEALDELMKMGDGEFVATLDADAFPISYGWDELLVQGLNDNIAVGIEHLKPLYAHPSCFIARREDLKGLSWRRDGNRDVGRVISDHMMGRGSVHLMKPTDFFAKNPTGDHEPPIGAVYDRAIFHNWYTSRTKKTANPDGIPNRLIEDSIQSALERYQ